jgi:hypothetical protein
MSNNQTNEKGDMHMNSDKYVGLDVHKDTTVVAIAEGGREGECRIYGTISSDLHALERVLAKLGGEGTRLHVAYEAGPTGYVGAFAGGQGLVPAPGPLRTRPSPLSPMSPATFIPWVFSRPAPQAASGSFGPVSKDPRHIGKTGRFSRRHTIPVLHSQEETVPHSHAPRHLETSAVPSRQTQSA